MRGTILRKVTPQWGTPPYSAAADTQESETVRLSDPLVVSSPVPDRSLDLFAVRDVLVKDTAGQIG